MSLFFILKNDREILIFLVACLGNYRMSFFFAVIKILQLFI